jgi:quercetin dioxygenase-like cupin family protein
MEPGRVATFKLLSKQTEGSVAVFEESVPVGAGTPLHIHHTSDEVIYISTGTLTIKLGEQVTHANAGSWIFIPRGVAHAWKNPGPASTYAAFIFNPADGAQFFEELQRLARPIPDIDPASLEALCRQHGYELVAFDWA